MRLGGSCLSSIFLLGINVSAIWHENSLRIGFSPTVLPLGELSISHTWGISWFRSRVSRISCCLNHWRSNGFKAFQSILKHTMLFKSVASLKLPYEKEYALFH